MSRQAPRYGAGGWSLTSLVRDLGTAWRLLWDPSVPGLLKLVLPVLALIYWLWPLDLLPGMPVDDIAVVLVAAKLFTSLASNPNILRAFGGSPRTARPQEPQADDANVVDTTWRIVDD
jgi:hypothetical protein